MMRRSFLRKALLPGVLCFLLLTAGTIDLDNLFDYNGQVTPFYITKDNQPMDNMITDEGATLGRVLFYDKQLSLNGTIACASCHKQEFAFSDTAVRSVGFEGGLTGRHSMRLINSRFADDMRFFWDKRAESLEDQTTMPVQDHVEMGFSGTGGQPGIDSLLNRLASIGHYQQLFTMVFGDAEVTEARIQRALAQFVRSIQSFDSKYDAGRAIMGNDLDPFPNYTAEENLGKELFKKPPIDGGAGCAQCHRSPEFDIDFHSLNNGVIGVAGSPGEIDLFNTRAPTLRDLVNPQGLVNGPLMHNGQFTSLEQVIDHYNLIPQNPANTNLDLRLQGPGSNLGLTPEEKSALVAFLRTLSGTNVYTDERWSDPFDANGNVTLIGGSAQVISHSPVELSVYPNTAIDEVNVHAAAGTYNMSVFSMTGSKVYSGTFTNHTKLDVRSWKSGIYVFQIRDEKGRTFKRKVIKD